MELVAIMGIVAACVVAALITDRTRSRKVELLGGSATALGFVTAGELPFLLARLPGSGRHTLQATRQGSWRGVETWIVHTLFEYGEWDECIETVIVMRLPAPARDLILKRPSGLWAWGKADDPLTLFRQRFGPPRRGSLLTAETEEWLGRVLQRHTLAIVSDHAVLMTNGSASPGNLAEYLDVCVFFRTLIAMGAEGTVVKRSFPIM